MLFAYDIVLIHETYDGVFDRLEVWRQILDTRGFKVGTTPVVDKIREARLR